MSVILYGQLMRRQDQVVTLDEAKEKDNQLVKAIAAIIPAEIIGVHALVLEATTATDKDGTTTITNPEVLKWSLPALVVVTLGTYIISRGGIEKWNGMADTWRLVIPAVAFVAWTALIGTSALTPWSGALGLPHAALVLAAGVVGVLIVAFNNRLNPKKT